MKRIASLLTLLLLTGCTVQRPTVLRRTPNPVGEQFVSVPQTTHGPCTNCPPAPKGWRWTWQHTNAGPQFVTFRFYGRPTLDASEKLLGTNAKPVWDQWFSNGPMQFVSIEAVDVDQPKTSGGKLK